MKSENGFSLVESVLTLFIIMTVFGTLLPVTSVIMKSTEAKKAAMHAAETAYQGALLFKTYGLTAGSRTLSGTAYHWSLHADSICVVYALNDKEIEKCVQL